MKIIAKILINFMVALTLVIGSATVGLIVRRLLLDFTDYSEHLARASAPIVFLVVIFFCAKNTRIG